MMIEQLTWSVGELEIEFAAGGTHLFLQEDLELAGQLIAVSCAEQAIELWICHSFVEQVNSDTPRAAVHCFARCHCGIRQR